MKRRVAVTGLGIISPCGNNIDDFSFNLMAGKSGVRRISSAYSSLLSVKIAAEVDFNPHDYFTKKQVSSLDRVNQFALAAAYQAWKDSELSLEYIDRVWSLRALFDTIHCLCFLGKRYRGGFPASQRWIC